MIEIGLRRSNFSQFSDDLWCYIKIDGTTINFDVDEKNFKSFTAALLDMAHTVMYKADNEAVVNAISNAMEILDKGE